MEDDLERGADMDDAYSASIFPDAPDTGDADFQLPMISFSTAPTDMYSRIRGILKEISRPQMKSVIIDGAHFSDLVINSGFPNRCYFKQRHLKACQIGEMVEYLECQVDPSGNLRSLNVSVAVKQLEKKKIRRREGSDNPIKEIQTMSILSTTGHPNVISLKECLHDSNYLYVIMEYAANELMPLPSIDDPEEALSVAGRLFYQLVSGLHFIHKKGFAHLDISLENLIIDGDHRSGTLKIIDFGVSCKLNKFIPFGTIIGKDYCIPPEMYSNRLGALSDINPCLVDVWDCGVILFLLLTGELPFRHANESDANFIRHLSGSLLADYRDLLDPDCFALLDGLLQIDPTKRLSLERVFFNSWLSRYTPTL